MNKFDNEISKVRKDAEERVGMNAYEQDNSEY